MIFSNDNGEDNVVKEELEGDCYEAPIPTLTLGLPTASAIPTLP